MAKKETCEMDESKPITFEEFEEKAKAILKEHNFNSKPVLFRGQAEASWELETSLERYSNKKYNSQEYWDVMSTVKPSLEAHKKETCDFSDEYVLDERPFMPPQDYPFMAYLRHLGFPSPLLDWTRSFHIAAFFAFQFAYTNDEPNVAIYSFNECPNGVKGIAPSMTFIFGCDPTIKTHERHSKQQAQYTYCKKQIGDKYVYRKHEDVFGRNDGLQDILKKFTIPKTERTKVLEKLDMMDINAYSLYGSEESLLETLAYQEIKQPMKY